MSASTIGVTGATSTGLTYNETIEVVRGLARASGRYRMIGPESLAATSLNTDVWNDRGGWTIPDPKALIRYSNAGIIYVNHPTALKAADGAIEYYGRQLSDVPFTREGIPHAARIIVSACSHVDGVLKTAGEPIDSTSCSTADWYGFERWPQLIAAARGESDANGERITVERLYGHVAATRAAVAERLAASAAAASERLAAKAAAAKRDHLKPQHIDRFLKAGHSLALTKQVAWSMSDAEDYPESLRDWARNGLGRPGGVTGIRYDFPEIRPGSGPWSQARPDVPAIRKAGGEEQKSKYLDSESHRIMAHPLMVERHRAGVADTLILAEGTNQHLSHVHIWADDPTKVVFGLPSCWGWSGNLAAVPDIREIIQQVNVETVFIQMDADQATNAMVNTAARRIGEIARDWGKKVRYARLDSRTGGSEGFDDYIWKHHRLSSTDER